VTIKDTSEIYNSRSIRRLVEVRAKLKLSLEAFSETLGVSIATLNGWLRGKNRVPGWVVEFCLSVERESLAPKGEG
jgi:DNA-binding transcriptional regulator YiaG